MPPNIIPQLITIRKQDLDSIKRLQQEKEKMRDYDNHHGDWNLEFRVSPDFNNFFDW